jgi:hypothetical protein
MAVKWIGLGTFLGIGFLEESFEKGNTRKITENRVTSWAFFTLGEFSGFTLIPEENWNEGLSFGLFLKEFGGGGTWGWRRGGTLCVNLDFWGSLIVSIGRV